MIRLNPYLSAAAISLFIVSTFDGVPRTAVDGPSNKLKALTATSASASTPHLLDGAVSADQTGVSLPNSSADPVVVGHGRGQITVRLPGGAAAAEAIGDGLVGYDGGDGTTSVPIAKEDGSVQFTTIIESPDSPTSFRYDLDLPVGAKLEQVEDGGVAVVGGDGTVLYGILAPWAVDATGAAVDTKYVLEGTALVQVVDHSAASKYPVVADPWLGGTWVQEWAWYSGIVRIALTPTTFAQWACPGNVVCAAAWQGAVQSELAGVQINAANKDKVNRATTGNQIGCHMVVGPLKSPWNLETDKPDYGLAGFIAAACNP
ncbi:DUF2599 domain-containing protein [Microbacterium rhizomatis]|nr:DUF2599 domain-containing protein [Microbacterium rhizomatis]